MPKNTERDLFFRKLHEDLFAEFGVDPRIIKGLRATVLGKYWEPQDFIDHLLELAKRPKRSRGRRRLGIKTRRRHEEFYLQGAKTLSSLPNSSIKKLLIGTEYDKKA